MRCAVGDGSVFDNSYSVSALNAGDTLRYHNHGSVPHVFSKRRLKLGYARAARIVDEMEERGIVGPFMGSKPRTILVTKEQWEAMRSGGSTQMAIDDMQDMDEEFDDDSLM